MNTEGLSLTRCDCCGRRQWCAVEGVAMCEACCPGAVEAARNEAKEARLRAAREANARNVELLPGEYDGPPIPYREVAHLFRF
jgi:hypothetical protein